MVDVGDLHIVGTCVDHRMGVLHMNGGVGFFIHIHNHYQYPTILI